MQHWRAKSTPPSILLQIAVSWHQLNLGTGVSFLEDVHTPHPHSESKWLASLRAYLATLDASLELDNPHIPPKQREHNFYLMDKVLESKKFTPLQIRQINYCQMYLQAMTVSDISNIKGDHIDPAKLQGTISLMSSQSGLHWINQERPNHSAWSCWRKACKLWSTKGKLHQPLGKWLYPSHKQRMKWAAYTSANTESVYIRKPGGYQVYYLIGDQTTSSPPCMESELPDDALPVDIDDCVSAQKT